MPLGKVRRRGVQNPGHSRLRQLAAPQPDAAQMAGFRPVDVMRRSNPMAARAVQRGGMPGQTGAKVLQAGPQLHNALKRPKMGMQKGQGRPRVPLGQYRNRAEYQQFSDFSNPNVDRPLEGGFNDAQVQWMKQNLLGWEGGGPGEGRRFQRELSQYIRQAGGMEAFQQMLGGMPGWGRRAGSPGAPRRNTADPTAPFKTGGWWDRPERSINSAIRPQGGWKNSQWPGQQGPQQQGQQRQAMFPHEQQRFAQQDGLRPQAENVAQQQMQQAMGGQRGPQAGGARPVSPQGQRPGQGPGQRPDATRQGQQGAQSPQARGQDLVRQPAARAAARAYGGETDREQQKKQDRDFFGKRGIPLTPEVEEGMRQLTDEYIQVMIDLGYAEADAAAAVQMEKQRLAEDMGVAQSGVNEAAAEAGVFNSSVRGMQQAQEVQQPFGRAYQDLAIQAAQQQRQFADARAAAIEAMRGGRQDLALMGTQQAVSSAAGGNQYTGLPTGRRRGKGSRRRSQR